MSVDYKGLRGRFKPCFGLSGLLRTKPYYGTECYTFVVRLAAKRELSVYKTRPFARFARRARLGDADLWQTATLVNQDSIDADLGGGVINQRIARAS